ASEVKRVAAAAAEEHDTVESLLHLAAIAGLTRQSTTRSVAPAGAAWLDSSLGTRWSVLADALARRGGGMFTELVSAGAGTPVREYGRWLTPLNGGNDPIPPDDLAAAEALGLAEDGRLTALGVALGTDPAVAVGAVLAAAPPTVEAVYLQQDLSVIAPGTLRADLDARLRQLSDVESRAEANSYRFTPESIERALLAGDRASDVLEFLERISLTGIPQSLRYLVEDQASRLDRIVVTPAPAGAGSVVTTDDERLAAQLAVDTELRLLELAHDGSRTVHSPYPAEFVHASLRDARHPARLAAAGSPEPPADASGTGRGDGPSPTAAPAPDRATVASQPFALLLSRLLAARPDTPGDFEQLWARRLLTTAVRERGTVRVRIRRSDGTEREAQLEPTGVSQERLRARDRENDTERTLPLSAIVEVTADV
ncbi:helicase-associated domain-containing protein, partial [Mycetocola reblochoni]